MTYLFTLTLTVLLQKNTRLFFLPLLLFSLLLWHWMPSLRPGALDRRLCSFPFWQKRLWRTCQLLSLWHRDHTFLFSRASMLKYFRWSLRHSARSLLVSAVPTNLPFLFSSPPIWLSLCPRYPVLSFIFPFTSISVRNCFLFSPVLSGHNGSPDTRFFRTTTRLMNWPDGDRYLFPQQSLVITLLLSLVSTLLFSRTGGLLTRDVEAVIFQTLPLPHLSLPLPPTKNQKTTVDNFF